MNPAKGGAVASHEAVRGSCNLMGAAAPPTVHAPCIQLFVGTWEMIGGNDWALARRWLAESELARAGQYRSRVLSERWILRRAFLRRVIAEELTMLPEDVVFSVKCPLCGAVDHGKPRVRSAAPMFSQTSCSIGTAIAVSWDADVGLDMEVAGAPVSVGLWRRISDCKGAGAQHRPARAERLRIWVRKEAIAKGNGCGLTQELRSLRWCRSEDEPWCGVESATPRWFVRDWTLPGIVGAVAATRPLPLVLAHPKSQDAEGGT
jgi:phosphopantetheinyl transferase